MTTPELVRRVRSAWKEIKGGFYLAGTTTGAGNAGGTTLVSTGLSALDDFYNQKEVVLTSGDASGQRRLVSDFDAASDTITLESTVGWQIASGVTFELGEQGLWSDREILDWANDGQHDIMSKLTDEVLFKTMNKTADLTIASGVATLESDFNRPIHKYVLIDSQQAPIIQEYQRFLYDSFMTYKAIYRNGKLEYRPSDASTVTQEYVKDPAEITNAVNPDIPDELHLALVDYVIHRGWAKQNNEQGIALSNKYLKEYQAKVETFNAQWQNRIN